MLTIDGSMLEGGGQLVRVALALSAICRVPIRIHRIRANRMSKGRRVSHHNQPREGTIKKLRRDQSSKPAEKEQANNRTGGGLKESHQVALTWLASQCDATVTGNQVGSIEITFKPGTQTRIPTSLPRNEDEEVHEIVLLGPGSVWLIFQAIFPYIVFGNLPIESIAQNNTISLLIRGGTHVSNSMSTEYVEQVFLPTCERIGLPRVEVETLGRGWAGNTSEVGGVKIRIHLPPQRIREPHTIPGFHLTQRGEVSRFMFTIIAQASTHDTIVSNVSTLLRSNHDAPLEVHPSSTTESPRRISLLLVAHTTTGQRIASSHLGTGRLPKTKTEETKLLREASEALVKEMLVQLERGGCVDEFMQDQLVIFQALADRISVVDGGRWKGAKSEDEGIGDEAGTLHARTVRWVCETMLGDDVRFEQGGRCRGVGTNELPS